MVPFILFLEYGPVLSVSLQAIMLRSCFLNTLSCTSGSDYVSSASSCQIRLITQFVSDYVLPVLMCIDANLSLGRLPLCKHVYMAYAFSMHRREVEALYKSTSSSAEQGYSTSTPHPLIIEQSCRLRDRPDSPSDCSTLNPPVDKVKVSSLSDPHWWSELEAQQAIDKLLKREPEDYEEEEDYYYDREEIEKGLDDIKPHSSTDKSKLFKHPSELPEHHKKEWYESCRALDSIPDSATYKNEVIEILSGHMEEHFNLGYIRSCPGAPTTSTPSLPLLDSFTPASSLSTNNFSFLFQQYY